MFCCGSHRFSRPETQTRLVRILAGGELLSKIVSLSEESEKRHLPEWAAAHLRLHVFVTWHEPGAAHGPDIDLQARLVLLGRLQAARPGVAGRVSAREDCVLEPPGEGAGAGSRRARICYPPAFGRP